MGARMSKGFKVCSFLLILVLSPPQSLAAPCYGTKMPHKKEVVMGVQTYTFLQRHLEAGYGTLRSFQHFYLLTYGLTDWFSLDLKGGVGNIKQRPLTSSELDYPSEFAGGYGFRMKIFENLQEDIKAVWGFQHISVHPGTIYVEGLKNESILDDWQLSLLASKSFCAFTPYLGVKLSRVDYIHRENDQRKRKMSDLTQSWGIVVGIDIPLNEKTYINLEGHAIDEDAFSAAVMYKF